MGWFCLSATQCSKNMANLVKNDLQRKEADGEVLLFVPYSSLHTVLI